MKTLFFKKIVIVLAFAGLTALPELGALKNTRIEIKINTALVKHDYDEEKLVFMNLEEIYNKYNVREEYTKTHDKSVIEEFTQQAELMLKKVGLEGGKEELTGQIDYINLWTKAQEEVNFEKCLFLEQYSSKPEDFSIANELIESLNLTEKMSEELEVEDKSSKIAPTLCELIEKIAQAYGIKTPVCVLRSGYLCSVHYNSGIVSGLRLGVDRLKLLTNDEITFVVAHELAHLKSNHANIRSLYENIFNYFLGSIENKTELDDLFYKTRFDVFYNCLKRTSEKEADTLAIKITKNSLAAITIRLKTQALRENIKINSEDNTHPTPHERISYALWAYQQMEQETNE